jgi:tetratricopeptide (TPR) repeat protein
MKLTLDMHRALASINAALMKGDQSALEDAFGGVNLEQLLSQDTIAITRALGKKPITLLLCTLAEQNGVDVVRAKHWLACYQSILRKQLEAPLDSLSRQNVIRIALESLVQHQPLTAAVLSAKKIKGNPQAWQDALELLLDHKDWTSALELLRHLGKQPAETQIWLQLAKSLSRRHPLYVEESGQAQVDVDYQILARLYLLCADAARRAKVPNVYKALVQLASSALETDGDYGKAIDQLTALDPQNNTLAFQIDLARCLCKQGESLASIARLDRAIELLIASQNPSEAFSADALQGAGVRHDGAKAEKSFDVNKAARALSDLTRMANEKGTPVFLVSGTLLGYVREGQLLAHDKDIDVGIVGWENQYELCMALQETGLFTVSTQYLKGKDTYYIAIKHNDTGMWIDVFVYHPQGSHWVTGVDFFFGYRQTFAFTPFELQEIEFLGVKMQAPANAELNLTENYGNWRVPDASYLSHLESPSTMDKGNLSYMITARMSMLSACLTKKNLKIEKILSLMRVHQQMPGAMPEELMTKIEAAHLKPVAATQDVCHA